MAPAVAGVAGVGSEGVANLRLAGSAVLDGIVRELDLEGARLRIVDRGGQVIADSAPETDGGPARGGAVSRRLIDQALAGGTAVARRRDEKTGAETILAAAPIAAKDGVIGLVVIEQSTDKILALQQGALRGILGATLAVFAAVASLLLIFSMRLTWRIHRLSREAEAAIDANGKVTAQNLRADSRAGDEVGDLSRSVSGLLGKLYRYTRFLERMPRTLRHELSNPLNTLSTSLQNLAEERPELAQSKYLQAAGRGVARLTGIVEGLTDAASLEDALSEERMTRLDLAALVGRYMNNCSANGAGRSFAFHRPGAPAIISGSEQRIEQMLDKLIDNAMEFSPERSVITVRLRAEQGEARLTVANQGPPIPENVRETMFDLMTTSRGAERGGTHLGIGLYVARVIAERHGGRVDAGVSGDGGGVEISVCFPLHAAG